MRPHNIHFGLRARITLITSTILIITFAAIAYFLVHNVLVTDVRNLNQSSTAFAALATPKIGNTYSVYSSSGSIYIDKEIQDFTSLDSNVNNVFVVNLSGDVLFSQNNSPAFHGASQGSDFNTTYTKDRNGLITQIIVPYIDDNGQHPFALAYEISNRTVDQDIYHQIVEIIAFSSLGLLASAVVMYFFTSRFFVAPVESVSRQALTISQGHYDQTINVKRNDEVGDLAVSVNKMSQSLKDDIAKLEDVDRLKNEFMSITSHNLRTPLTIIKGNLELLGVVSQLTPSSAKLIKKISDSAARLGIFAEDMLTIASIEGDKTELKLEKTTISDLTSSLHEMFVATAAQNKVTLKWDINNLDAIVYVSPFHIREVIRNLLDNALKFTKEGGEVQLWVGIMNNSLVITVQDSGIGISEEEQKKLFTKFHRSTSTMQYDYEGTGIGLYLSKLIAEAHQGTIQFKSELGQGSIFTVAIPIQVPEVTPTPVDKTQPPATDLRVG